MKRFTGLLTMLSLFAFLMLHSVLVAHASAVEQDAETAIARAQEVVAELTVGIEQAAGLLAQARESGDEQAYQMALQAKEAAEQMLALAQQHLEDAVNMANASSVAPSDTAAGAASYSSQAKAETSQSFARVGMLYLEALQFAAGGELNCSEKINKVSDTDRKTWQDLKKIEALAGQSFNHARSALMSQADAAAESEKSEEAARECIALARELDLQLQDFEDICDDFKKRWQEMKDQEDDEPPSPV